MSDDHFPKAEDLAAFLDTCRTFSANFVGFVDRVTPLESAPLIARRMLLGALRDIVKPMNDALDRYAAKVEPPDGEKS